MDLWSSQDLDAASEATHDRCECHVCHTLREVLSANVEADRDRRVVTPLLLTYEQAGELLGVPASTVRRLVAENELRPVRVHGIGKERIPRVEVDEYVSRLLEGELRRWVAARRQIEQWGLRYMADRVEITTKRGVRSHHTNPTWHLGDGHTTLCGASPKGRWETTTRSIWITRFCPECELIRDERVVASQARRRRKVFYAKSIVPMLTVAEYAGGGEAVRRKGWHLGDGKTTLCGLTRDKWKIPERQPRSRPCAVCQRSAGLEPETYAPLRVEGRDTNGMRAESLDES